VQFNWKAALAEKANQVLLSVVAEANRPGQPFRMHVYYIPEASWKASTLQWNNAPGWDGEHLRMKKVGTAVHVAGEWGIDKAGNYTLDITEIIKKYNAGKGTFVLLRETRQLGDDEDKGRVVRISTLPHLQFVHP